MCIKKNDAETFKTFTMKKNFFILLMLIMPMALFAQQKGQPVVSKAKFMDKSEKLVNVTPVPPGSINRTWKDGIVKNKFDWKKYRKNLNPISNTNMSNVQREMGKQKLTPPQQNFAGLSNEDNSSRVSPPDTDGDVGLNHYMQMVNNSFEVFDKSGNTVYGPADNSTIWNGFTGGSWVGTNDGDPIILYDEQADKWLVTQFAINTSDGLYWMLLAVSETGDPTGAYYRYAYEFDFMPDYPKFGVWEDGYYLSVNQFSNSGGSWSFEGAGVAVFEREEMIAGNLDARMIYFNVPDLPNGGSDCAGMLPSDADGDFAPTGTPNQYLYFNDDAWGFSNDHLQLWEFSTDWTNTANTTFEYASTLITEPFDSEFESSFAGGAISQPGTSQKLDVIADRLMFKLQYRNFGTHQSILANHTVDVATNQAGIRWYELRNTSGTWEIEQQGTYAPDTDNRWMGTIGMDANGNIALGYTVSSATMYPSIKYTGRRAEHATGQMTYAEMSVVDGTSSQSDNKRWGDYAKMSIDPSADTVFWFTHEYSGDYGGSFTWATQIASFYLEDVSALPPTAQLAANKTNVEIGGSVQFSDNSYYDIDSRTWTFEGGVPETSTEANPTVMYPVEGIYDVSLTVVNANGTNTETKEDYIIVANMYNMSNTSITTCSGTFFDAGGASGQYSDGEDYTLTINPASPGAMISVDFIEFNVEENTSSSCYDILAVYDGTSTSADLIGEFCGTTSPGIITATNTDGALTFRFTSDVAVTRDGWMANIECIGGSVAAGTAAATNAIVCENQSATIQLSGSYGDIQWQTATTGGGTFTDVTDGTGATSQYYITEVLTVGAFYRAKVSMDGSDVYSNEVEITITPAPTADFSYTIEGYEVTFINNSTNSDDFTWNFGDGNTSTEQSPVYDYDSHGTYNLSLTASANSCEDAIAEQSLTLNLLSVNDVFADNYVTVYPNPSNGKFQIKFVSSDYNEIKVNIINSIGQQVFSEQIEKTNKEEITSIDLTNLAKGIYQMKIIAGDNISVRQIIIQ